VCDETLVSLIQSCTTDESILKQVQEITLLGIKGKINMLDSYKQRLSLARPTVHALNTYLSTILDKITPGMESIIKRIHERSLDIHIVSLGPLCCIVPVAQHLNIPLENVHAVRVDFQKGEATGIYIDQTEEILNFGKVKMMEKWIKEGIISSPIIMIGDGLSDMKIRESGLAKIGICFGLFLKIKEAKVLSDHYVEDIDEFEKVLFEEINHL
jgi:D-3-phosphoglycerate dehydrogenase